MNATGPARDMKTLAKSKTQKALWQINDPDAPLHLPLRAPHHKNAFVAAAEAMAAAPPAPSPRPTTTTRTKGMTYFQRLAADAEAARQARLERLKAEAKAAEEAGALGGIEGLQGAMRLSEVEHDLRRTKEVRGESACAQLLFD